MIERLELVNFESHTHTIVDFSQGVNIITGNSDAGKSSLLRALRLVLNNEPGGEDFINFNADSCAVILHVNGHEVVRKKARNNKVNEYVLNGKVLKAFGQSVPDEVKAVTGLTEVNAEWQFDRRPFLLAETGGYIASKLNEIVNLELIDYSLKNIASTKRENAQKLDSASEQHEALYSKIDGYNWIATAKNKLEAIKANEKDLSAKQTVLASQRQIVSQHTYLQSNLRAVKVIEQKQIDKAGQLISKALSTKKQYRDRTAFIQSIRSIVLPSGVLNAEKLKAVDFDAEKLNSLKMGFALMQRIKKDIDEVSKKANEIGVLNDRRVNRTSSKIADIEALQKSHRDMRNLANIAVNLQSDIVALEEELNAINSEYKRIAPATCPLCGGEFKKELAQ